MVTLAPMTDIVSLGGLLIFASVFPLFSSLLWEVEHPLGNEAELVSVHCLKTRLVEACSLTSPPMWKERGFNSVTLVMGFTKR